MPTLETTDGKPVDVTPADAEAVNAKFRAAMDSEGTDEQAPPKRQPKTAGEDTPRAARRTRQPKEDKARTAPAVPVKDDYTEDAQDLVGSVWTVAASIQYTQPYALVIESNSDALVGALADGAKQNATVRAFVSSGKSSWMLTLASVSLNMGMQAWQIAKDPELQERARAITVEHLKAAIGAKNLDVQERSDHDEAVPAAA